MINLTINVDVQEKICKRTSHYHTFSWSLLASAFFFCLHKNILTVNICFDIQSYYFTSHSTFFINLIANKNICLRIMRIESRFSLSLFFSFSDYNLQMISEILFVLFVFVITFTSKCNLISQRKFGY